MDAPSCTDMLDIMVAMVVFTWPATISPTMVLFHSHTFFLYLLIPSSPIATTMWKVVGYLLNCDDDQANLCSCDTNHHKCSNISKSKKAKHYHKSESIKLNQFQEHQGMF